MCSRVQKGRKLMFYVSTEKLSHYLSTVHGSMSLPGGGGGRKSIQFVGAVKRCENL